LERDVGKSKEKMRYCRGRRQKRGFESEELEGRIPRQADMEALFEGGQRSTSGFAPLKNYGVVYISLYRCVCVSRGTSFLLGYSCPT
jgi:hypothetical protein